MQRDLYYHQPVVFPFMLLLTGSFALSAAPFEKVNPNADAHGKIILQETLTPPQVVDLNVEATTVNFEIIENNNEGSTTEIYRSLSSDGGYELIASFPWDDQVYTDADLRRRTTYYYRFRAVRDGDASDFSDPLAVTTFSNNYAPTVTARAVNENTIEITFTDNSFNDIGYILSNDDQQNDFFEEFVMSDSGQTRVFTHHPVDPGTTQYYNVVVRMNGEEQPTAFYNNIASATTPGSVECAGIGSIEWEVWRGIEGTDVSSIPVEEPPVYVRDLTIFETPNYFGNNYGGRIRGYVCVPQSGDYTFWIASDDNSALYLSTDDTPANKVMIASVPGHTASRQWNKYPSQQSVLISLEEGRRYYVEVLHKEGSGADHVSVGWQLPDGTLERPIPGIRLIEFEVPNRPALVDITSPEDGAVFEAPATITISAEAVDPDNTTGSVSVDFSANGEQLVFDSEEPFTYQWTDVPPGEYWITAQAWDGTPGERDSVRITVTGGCEGTGTIVREVWRNISGTDISTVPFNTTPDDTYTYTSFETPQYFGNNYGSRMRGYVCVQTTGDYTFWVAGDDDTELWLSTDEDPANATLIANVPSYTAFRQWNKFGSQESSAIHLEAGRKYYIEARHKEGGGNDHISVGWQLPNGTLQRPIPGTSLMPFDGPPVSACADDPDAGSIEREIWRNIPGTSIASIPVNDEPDNVVTLSSFETGTYYANEYGSRIRAYICVPASGDYTFWIASDDNSELWLSTDDNPANKVRIASVTGSTSVRQWDKYPSQTSMPVSLEADRKYYIEVLHKEAGGNDHVAVGWQLPDGTLERPIPGNRLILYRAEGSTLAASGEVESELHSARVSDEIRLYPNPTTNRTVELSFISERDAAFDQSRVEIISFTGEIVYSETVECEQGCSGATISLENNVPPGVYLVRVNRGDVMSTQRLVIK